MVKINPNGRVAANKTLNKADAIIRSIDNDLNDLDALPDAALADIKQMFARQLKRQRIIITYLRNQAGE